MGDAHAFVFVGLPGAGKSEAAAIAEQSLRDHGEDAVHTEVSDYVRAKFESSTGDEVDDNELGRWAADIKEDCGEGYFVREMVQLHSAHDKHLLLSGVRSPAEAEAVEEAYGPENTHVIAIWTLPDVRFERKYGDPPSEEHDDWPTFLERKERELWDWRAIEFFYPESAHAADYIVPNHYGRELLRENVTSIVHTVLAGREGSFWSHSPFGEGLDREAVAQYL